MWCTNKQRTNRVFSRWFGQNISSKWSISSLILLLRTVSNSTFAYMEQFFSIVRKNALKMRRMRKLVNYADPHHRILSDALINAWIMGILIKNASIMWKYEIIGQQIKWEKIFFSDVSCTHRRTCVYGRYAPGLLLAQVCYSLWFYMWRIPYYNLSCHNLTNDDLMFVH